VRAVQLALLLTSLATVHSLMDATFKRPLVELSRSLLLLNYSQRRIPVGCLLCLSYINSSSVPWPIILYTSLHVNSYLEPTSLHGAFLTQPKSPVHCLQIVCRIYDQPAPPVVDSLHAGSKITTLLA
jgi:hypothetical protein